jgi:hypothetical protein
MAINPFRVGELQLPQPLRPVPIDFSPLQSIGEGIGQYRQQQQIGGILAGATGPDGQLDLDKAARDMAAAGFAGQANRLLDSALRQKALTSAEADRAEGRRLTERGQDITSAHQKALEADLAERRRITEMEANRPTIHAVPPSLTDPGGIYSVPRQGGAPTMYPFPGATAAPGPVPAVPTAVAPAGPAVAPQPQAAVPATAAPVVAPVVAPAPADAKAAPVYNEDYLNSLRTPQLRSIVKQIANYDVDVKEFEAKDRPALLAAAKQYRPDFNASEFQKRGTPPSGEVAGRVGLGNDFLSKLDDTKDEQGNVVPGIRSRIIAGETASLGGRAQAFINTGGPGELARVIDGGAESLERMLTGAGMPASEAATYKRRYAFDIKTPTREDQVRKLNELEQALRYVGTEVGRGRGGKDLVTGFQSQFGKAIPPALSARQTPTAATKVEDQAGANLRIQQARDAVKAGAPRDAVIKRLQEQNVPNAARMLGPE